MSGISRSAWIKLYKDLFRASNKFPQYNYRLFAKRRTRDYFELHRKDSPEQLAKLFEEGQETLKTIKRQADLSKSFPQTRLVIEEPTVSKF
uniref:Complex 1 LYR protein domain-containing protein n=1 Tax=Panagrolaimus sp. JU765 TaxID=591449 RepID=A0AC34QLW5_9BILA